MLEVLRERLLGLSAGECAKFHMYRRFRFLAGRVIRRLEVAKVSVSVCL